MNLAANCPGPFSRRTFLRMGSLSLGGLGLSDLLKQRSLAAEIGMPAKDTSVILVWLAGGPSQLETYDLKPDAPAEIRGEFRPIPTVVPGLDLCEHFPLQAKIADKFSVIRSIRPGYQDHGPGTWAFLSGQQQPVSASDGPAHFPEIGSIVAWARRQQQTGLPQFVAQKRIFQKGHAYLGPAYAPYLLDRHPGDESFKIDHLTLQPELVQRLDDRRRLLDSLDLLRRDTDITGTMEAMDSFHQQAFDLLTSEQARNAFDLSQETSATRERYGDHHWGQSALLARRLAEAGCGLIQLFLLSPEKSGYHNGYADNWDDHSEAVRGNIFESMRRRLPILDRAVSALIEDIYNRGSDRKVMVIVTGEFGRTPRLSTRSGRPGREHWGDSMSVLVSGGGTRTGQVIGSTNAYAEHPQSRPLHPTDLLATIYRFLGIDSSMPIIHPSGRPLPILPRGEPIAELV